MGGGFRSVSSPRMPILAQRTFRGALLNPSILRLLGFGVWGLMLTPLACVWGPAEPVHFQIPREPFPDFLDTPWPSDLLLRPADGGGGLDLRAFPNPSGVAFLEDYVAVIQNTPGYASSGPLYFRVEGGLDPDSLPATPVDSTAPDASMYLVELAAPDRRIPLRFRYYADGTSFLPPHTVAVAPVLGYVVRGPAALMVTQRARHANGNRLGPSADMRALLTCEAVADVEVQPDCAPYASLREALGLSEDDVALMQIFTPYDATTGLRRAYQFLRAQPAPEPSSIERLPGGTYDLYAQYTGEVDLAQFQAGLPPFASSDGTTGAFVFDAAGEPIVQRGERVQFLLTVPAGTMPSSGWPVAINGHGTGGDLWTGLGMDDSAEAYQLAAAGWAMLAISEPLHATRDGHAAGEEEIQTFNFLNPMAGRDNWRQSALEKVQLVSMVETLRIPAAVSQGADITFDASQVAYFGHSQGAITGSLFLGVEDRIVGAFLSGAGGGFATSLVDKTLPVNIGEVLRTFLQMPETEVLDVFHPVLALLQTWIEPAEPLNYGALWRYRENRRTPHVLMTSGSQDSYTPPRTHAGFAGAFELAPIGGGPEMEVLTLKGLEPASLGSMGNLQSAQGEPLSAGILQYPDDGHFAVYQNPSAKRAFRHFFATLKDGVPALGKP